MRKSLLSVMLIIALVMSVGVMANAKSSSDDVRYEVAVTSPFVQWVDTSDFSFVVDVNEGLKDSYQQTKQFEVRSTTRYRIELQLLQYGGPSGISVNPDSPRKGTIEDLFDAAVQGWPSSGFKWEKLDNFQTRVDYNTLGSPSKSSVHTLGLKLVLRDDNGKKWVRELPSGTYHGVLRLVVTENLK